MADLTVAPVTAFERVTDDDGNGVEIKCDQAGGQLSTIFDFPPSNFDSPPLVGDFAAIKPSTGRGNMQAVGYANPKLAGKALGGETRIIARAPDGSIVFELWMHTDTKVFDVQCLASGYTFRFGKLEIDQDGNLTTPGEITAKAGTPGLVTLTGHIHSTGTGPSSPATPGM